jgi:peptidoglycan-associated lipoprotein
MRTIGSLVIALSLVTTVVACSKNKGAAPPSPRMTDDRADRPAATERKPGTATVTPVGDGADTAPDLRAIYFEFDSVTLSTEARAALERLAGWMESRTNRVTIEGHADERGTTEYNVALGQRRAEVIAEYLARLGVARARLETISYGEERPSAEGDDEAAWARNRRGEIRPR